MDKSAVWYVKTGDGKVYGPAEERKLVTWAEEGRIDSVSFVSRDCQTWIPAQKLSVLAMKWLVETEPGKVFGPFNRAVAIRLFKESTVPPTSRAYLLHELAIDQDPPPVERIVEKEVVREIYVEVPMKSRDHFAVAKSGVSPRAFAPAKVSRPLFLNFGREKLQALEAAAQRELAAAQRRGGGKLFGFLGGKKR